MTLHENGNRASGRVKANYRVGSEEVLRNEFRAPDLLGPARLCPVKVRQISNSSVWIISRMTPMFLNGVGRPWSYELKGGINSLGRNPTNDFRVSDPSVSSFHCELEVTEESVLVRDLGSTNGTFVDGERIKEARLQPGQLLRLGSAELKLEEQAIRIAIPTSAPEPAPAPVELQNGVPSCANHVELAAAYKCTHCNLLFCFDCVRMLKRAGGKTLLFCPSCSGTCEKLAPGGKGTLRPKKQSLLGRLTQTIRLRLK
jgi:FHA domain